MRVKQWKLGDSLRIGPHVWIKVVEVRGNQVRLGIEAPSEVPIFREELVPREKQGSTPGAPESETENDPASSGEKIGRGSLES